MKKLTKSLLLFLLCLSLYSASKAQGIMNYLKETHDFGNIDEGSIAEYEFEFTNTGDQPIEITRVQASCGCTTPKWTNKPIFPGDKGTVKASYNSEGRPGVFNKSITVHSNSQKNMHVLFINGFVKSKVIAPSEGANFKQADVSIVMKPASIQMSKMSHDFGRIQAGTKVTERFFVHNNGETALIITGIENRNPSLSFGLSNVSISINDQAMLDVTLETDKLQTIDDEFVLSTNDPKNKTVKLRIKAEIYENFANQMFKVKKSDK